MKKSFLIVACIAFFSIFIFAKEGIFYLYEPDRNDGKTASGEVFDASSLTCAHSFLPFGTEIHISYPQGKSVDRIRVNDRIIADENTFAVSSAVMDALGASDKSIINTIYSIDKKGDGAVAWKESNADKKWYSIKGIKSANLFDLYSLILKNGYKAVFESNSLTLLYIRENELKRAFDMLSDMQKEHH